MRVLISSTSDVGHVFPMLPLARALMSAGHDVLLATGADACDTVRAAGLDAASAGLTGDPLRARKRALVAHASTLPPPKRADFMFPQMFGATFTPPMVADLLPVASAWRPDLLVHEHGELASPLVGAVLGVPSWTHAFGGGIPPAQLEEAGQVVAPLWSEHGLTVPPHAGCFVDGYLDICPASVQTVPLEHVGTTLAVRPVAASVGTPAEPLDGPAEDGPPLVYLTLGTVPQPDSPLPRLVDALAQLPVRLLVAVGRHLDPATMGRQPAHVRVERWVDQPEVLRRCAVVASHGGSGTFLGALSHGVPQLCLPQAADQFRNAAGGTRAGAALALPPPDATPQAVRDAVTRLLGDDDVRRRAEQVAAEIAAMPSPGEVAEALVRTVRTRAAGAP